MFGFVKIRRNQLVAFYWLLVNTITMTIQTGEYGHRTIQCYICRGGKECGISFSPNSDNSTQYLSRFDNKLWNSCSIMVSPEGITTRDLVPSKTCRSSAYQFCCKDNLCNSLPSPPLPAFTNLTCILGVEHCSSNDASCNDGPHVVFRSSAAESCSVTQQKERVSIYKSYRKICFPGIGVNMEKPIEESVTIKSWCCNSFNCNQQVLPEGIAIRCYVCDSRVTGLLDCSKLNESGMHVYRSGSSSHFESCATIIGLAGQDALTNTHYSAFVIRTFIANCTDQPVGDISYGGATFQGRVSCCSTDYCNKEFISPALDIYLPSTIARSTNTKPTMTTTTRSIETTTTRSIETTTTRSIETTTTRSIETTTSTIGMITQRAEIQAETATRSKSGFYTSTTIRTILAVIIICGLSIVILQIVRRFVCSKLRSRDRKHSSRNSMELIPIASTLDPSTSPFTHITTEL